MTKPAITTRATKGSALTWTEGDTNLENLRDATITLKAGSGGTDVTSDLNGTVTLVAGSNITLTGDNSAKTITIASSGGSSGISSVSQDTSPQLGGNLNMTNRTIYGGAGIIDDGVTNQYQMQIRAQSGKNLNIKKGDGNGLYLNDQTWPASGGSAGQVLTTDGSGNCSWSTPSGGGLSSVSADTSPQLGGNLSMNWHTIYGNTGIIDDGNANPYQLQIRAQSGKNLSIKKGDGNGLYLNDQCWPANNGPDGTYLKTDAYGNLSWAAAGGISSVQSDTNPQLGGNLNIGNYAVGANHGEITTYGYNFLVQAKSGYNLSLKKGAGNNLFLNDQTWPASGGTSGQVLTTDGSGNCSWSTPSGSGNNIVVLDIDRIQIPTTGRSDDGFQVNAWTLLSSGGISGVSVNGSNGRFTLPAGTWIMEMPQLSAQYAQDWSFYSITDSQEICSFANAAAINGRYYINNSHLKFTTTGSTTVTFANQVSSTSNVNYWTNSVNVFAGGALSSTNRTIIKIYKVA